MNIKDSYIHGDLAVVRGLKSLSINNNRLILTYTKAEPLQLQNGNSVLPTYTIDIPISDFNNTLSNAFLPLSGGTMTGDIKIDKSSNTVLQTLHGLTVNAKNISIGFGVGTGGSNRGVYDLTQSTWLIYTNGTNTFLPIGNVGIGTTSSTEKLEVNGNIKATKFIKNSSSTNILLANGEDIALSTLTNAFTGTVSVTNTSDSPSKLQVTVGSKSGSAVVGYAKQAHDLYRTTLTNGLDLNSLTDEGVYVTTSSAVIQSLVNNPSGVTIGEYRLEVVQLNSESTGSYVILNLTRTSGNAITNYQRSRNSSGLWSSWHIQYDDVTLTKSVITNLIGTTTYAPYNSNGYLPLSGGTLTGNLAEDISVKSRIYYIMHMNADFNASDTSNIRAGIFYRSPEKDNTAATSVLASYTNHGLGLYIVGSKFTDYSRLIMSFLSGIYLDSDTSITGNLTTSGSLILKNGSTSTYTTINAKTSSGNITLNLPSSSGTLALTTQIPTSFTITANATDGLWDLTGTGGSNAVTYAVGAYSTQLSKASFDTSSTNPTRSDRLNYNGYFYATKLYSGAKEVITSDNASNLKWANLSVSSSVNYATKPVFDQVSIGGSSSVTAGAATIKYNSTNQSIDFIFN